MRTRGNAPALVAAAVLSAALAIIASPSAALAQQNSSCLPCHEPTVQFEAGPVDRDTACRACHTPGLLGTHPYHQTGANCGAYCHPGWGESLVSAVPAFMGSAGSFASATSQDTTSGILHIIHASPRWPADIDTSVSKCASCHSTAACDACHTGGVSAQHAVHSSTTSTAWSGVVGYGIIGEDQTIDSATLASNYCASSGCHDVTTLQSESPLLKENFTHDAYPEYGYPEANTVSKTGSWGTRYGTVFTGGQMSYSNDGGATLSIDFNGRRAELVTDKDPYRGICEIRIDGDLVATVDLYSTTTKYQRTVWRSDKLDAGPHVFEIRATGDKNASARAAFVTIDAMRLYVCSPDDIAPGCTSTCHTDKDTGHGSNFSHEATHTAGTYPAGRFACTDCHSLSMTAEHTRTSSKTKDSGCGACHTTYAPLTLDTYDFTCGWSDYGPGCHQVANSQDPHNFNDTNHDASGIGATADCRSCHGDDLSVIHDDSNASRGQHASLVSNGWTTDCLTCHGTDVFPTTLDCTDAGCHVGSGVVSMATHPAPAHNGTNNNAAVLRTGGESCSTCHLLELTSEHGKATSLTDPGDAVIGCTDCHNAAYFPAGWLDTPGTSNTCNACHDPAGAADAGLPHESAEYTAKHDWSATMDASCGGALCHDTDTIDFIHTDPWNATVTDPRGSSCKSCHDTPNAIPDETSCLDCHVAHDTITPHDADAPALLAANSDCLTCHTTLANIVLHPGMCYGCHNHLPANRLDHYLKDNYTARCTDCHNAASPAGYDYQPYDPNHYDPYLASHTATYGADAVPTGGSVITSKPCAACHATSLKAEHLITLSSGSVECFDCHTSTAPIDAVAVINADWPADKCADCHGVLHNSLGTSHDLSASATALGCSAVGCHEADTDDVSVLHADTVSGPDTSCNVCHASADSDLSAITGCDSAGCHSGGAHDMTLHEVTTDTGGCLACHGDDGVPADDVRGIHTDCDQCHSNPTYPGITSGNTSDCVSCHNASEVAEPDNDPNGDYSPYDPNHYNGTETSHTAAPFTAAYQGVGGDGATPAGGEECADCHSSTLKEAHASTSSSGGSVSCPDCHTDTTLGSATQVTSDWANDKCKDCHDSGAASTHDTYETAHEASTTRGCAGSGSGCHGSETNLAVLHQTNASGGAPAYNSCSNSDTGEDCHSVGDTRPTKVWTGTDSCGSGSGGCHTEKTTSNHGPDHDYTLSSAYADGFGEGAEIGCADSGAGCHASATSGDAVTAFHAQGAIDCLTSQCHVSPTMDAAWKASNSGAECSACHDGSFVNAPDAIGLTVATPNGHYPTALHTAIGGLGTVSAGGSASAGCNDCHELSLKDAHQGAAFSSSTLGSKVTCAECHTAAMTEVKINNWTNNRCDDCHNGGVAGSTHGVAAPVVNASSSAGCGASGAGCHGTYDMHSLHANATGCDLSGCHDAIDKDMSSASKTCGEASGCHTTATFTSTNHNGRTGDDALVHEASGEAGNSIGGYTQSTDCSDCHTLTLEAAHDSAGFASPHCPDCHNSTSPIDSVSVVKTTGWTNNECGDCHSTYHDAYTAAEHTSSDSSGCTIGACHAASGGSADVRDLHDKAGAGCSVSGTDSNGWTGACHDLDTGMTTTAMSCGTGATGLACHTSHTDTNHGGSTGGQPCDECHMALIGMAGDTSTYHHVLDAADPWVAPNGGPYPTSQDDLTCVSCHLDHSEYQALPGGSGKAYSLRDSATDANPTPTNTDDVLCLSCHSTTRVRNTTGQKANTIPETMVWNINVGYWNTPSPHNYDAPGPFNDGSIFYANCAKCHGNLQGTLSSGKFSVHFSAEQRLLNALGDTVVYTINEEQMCFRCHSVVADFGAGADQMPGTPKARDNFDWYDTQPMQTSNVVLYGQMNSVANTYGHKPTSYQNIHLLDEADEDQAYISANMHVECADCHNHHAVGEARHEWGTSNLVSEALRGVTGASFNTNNLSTTNWPTVSQVNGQIGWRSEAVYEYEICFKCHSSANTNYSTWGATVDAADSNWEGSDRWTNVAIDFNVGNQSRHPVLAPLPATDPSTAYGSSQVSAGQLLDIWSPGDTMYCSDCHGDSEAPLYSDPDTLNHAQGPHGSAIRYSLRGPRTSWPARNSDGVLYTINMVNAEGSSSDLFCMNCHPNVGGNKVHTNSTNHKAVPCVTCHLTVPHGGGMSRLIGDSDDSMPARYSYQGNKQNTWVTSFTKKADATMYQKRDCRISTYANGQPTCGSHSTGSSTSMENW